MQSPLSKQVAIQNALQSVAPFAMGGDIESFSLLLLADPKTDQGAQKKGDAHA